MSNFIVQALKGEPLTLFGDGSQTRSFCYVDDLIEGMIHLMNSSHTGPINLGNPEEFTIRQLANLVIQHINPELITIHKDLPLNDPMQRQPAIDNAKQFLHWEPKIPLEAGIEKTIADFRSRLAQI